MKNEKNELLEKLNDVSGGIEEINPEIKTLDGKIDEYVIPLSDSSIERRRPE